MLCPSKRDLRSLFYPFEIVGVYILLKTYNWEAYLLCLIAFKEINVAELKERPAGENSTAKGCTSLNPKMKSLGYHFLFAQSLWRNLDKDLKR